MDDASVTSARPHSSTLKNRRNKDDKTKKGPAAAVDQSNADKDPAAKSLKTPVVPPSSRPATAPLTVALTTVDVIIATLLTLCALATRGYKLIGIKTVVFDETHYINFSNHILRREYFFDVNPVWGKLVIAMIAKFLGYDETLPNVSLGDPFKSAQQGFSARLPSVILGSLTVPIFYRVCRLLHMSTYASVVAALFICFDSMHIIQSRIAMVDSILVFYCCLSLLFALYLWHAKNLVILKRGSVSPRDAASIVILLILTGVHCGLAASVRWTAFATPLLIFIISFFGIGPFCLQPLNELELLVLYGSAFLSYCGSFALFILQVNSTGPGDNFMSPDFQSCIIGTQHYTGPNGCKMSMWRRIWELNATIFRYSKGIRGKDKWGSSWFQWIVNWRGALYYRETPTDDTLSMIYLLMNPMMTLSIDLLMCLFVAALFLTVRYRKTFPTTDAFKEHLRRGSTLFFGWILSMLPTMVVYRSGPVYQYLPGLFFAQALAAIGFDLIPRPGRPIAALLICAGLVTAYVYWSPWVYGLPLTHAAQLKRRWLPRWD